MNLVTLSVNRRARLQLSFAWRLSQPYAGPVADFPVTVPGRHARVRETALRGGQRKIGATRHQRCELRRCRTNESPVYVCDRMEHHGLPWPSTPSALIVSNRVRAPILAAGTRVSPTPLASRARTCRYLSLRFPIDSII
jgi:hypothetical protein